MYCVRHNVVGYSISCTSVICFFYFSVTFQSTWILLYYFFNFLINRWALTVSNHDYDYSYDDDSDDGDDELRIMVRHRGKLALYMPSDLRDNGIRTELRAADPRLSTCTGALSGTRARVETPSAAVAPVRGAASAAVHCHL